MKYELVVKESAQNGLIDAFLYYENKQHGLGGRFLDNWEQTLRHLTHTPDIYQKKYKAFRQVLIKPFPYHIIYEIEGKGVVIYKVVYGGRHPRKRYSKL